MPPLGVRVVGLKEFVKAAKAVDAGLGKEVTAAHREIAKLMVERSQGRMRSGGRQAAKAAKGLKAKATQKSAALRNTANVPYALAAVWGAKRRVGWYARGRYEASTGRQFRAWVGNAWEPGAASGKPYFVGDAVNASVDEAIELLGDAFERVADKAFPD